MSSPVLTCASLHHHRARIFFSENAQQVERSTLRLEIARALAALATLAAWIAVVVLFA